jgi:hypothetical protein
LRAEVKHFRRLIRTRGDVATRARVRDRAHATPNIPRATSLKSGRSEQLCSRAVVIAHARPSERDARFVEWRVQSFFLQRASGHGDTRAIALLRATRRQSRNAPMVDPRERETTGTRRGPERDETRDREGLGFRTGQPRADSNCRYRLERAAS